MNVNLHSSQGKNVTTVTTHRTIFSSIATLLLLLFLLLTNSSSLLAQSSNCTMYAISNSTPVCGGITGTGVFFTRDDCNDTHVAWQAGPNLYLTENGNGTATITGTIINGSQVGNVDIHLTGRNSTGQLWTGGCYQNNLGSDLYYYDDFSGTITVGSTSYTIADQDNKDVGIGSGASNQGQGLGIGAWSGGTWGSCTELMGHLTPITSPTVTGNNRSTCGTDSTILTVNTPILYYESNGTVVMEAEHYSEMATRPGWIEETEHAGAVGSYMTVPNDNGEPFFIYDEGPKLIYKFQVSTPGIYNVYSRGFGRNGRDDSAWVGLNGDSIGVIGGAYGRWHWTNLGTQTLSAGTHELEISQRENGYILDRMMLSMATGPTGTETGPAECARTAAPTTVTWTPGNHTGRSIIVRPNTTTNYTANVTFEGGCTATDIVTAYVTPKPELLCYFNAGNGWEQVCDKTVAPGTNVSLSAHPAIDNHIWEWEGPNGFTATGRTINLGAATMAMEGAYFLKYTNEFGCSDEAQLNLFVNEGGDSNCTDAVTVANSACWEDEVTDCISCDAGNVVSLWKFNASFNNESTTCFSDQTGNFFKLLDGSVGQEVFFTLRDNNTAFVKGNFTFGGDDYNLYVEYSDYRNDSGINCNGFQENTFTFKAVNGWYKNCRTGEKTDFETNESIHIGYNANQSEIVLEGWYNNSAGIWKFEQVSTSAPVITGCQSYVNSGPWVNQADCSVAVNEGDYVWLRTTPVVFGTFIWTGPNDFSQTVSGGDGIGGRVNISQNITRAEAGTYTVTFISDNGCTATRDFEVSVGTPDENVCDNRIIGWDFLGCTITNNAYNNPEVAYSEFNPTITNSTCLSVQNARLFRGPGENKHSCPTGVDGTPESAICMPGSEAGPLDYDDATTFHTEVTLSPSQTGFLSGISFYQQILSRTTAGAGYLYDNNYPTKLAFRVVSNGQVVFEETQIPFSIDAWKKVSFDFSGIAAFEITSTTTFDFQLHSYAPIGIGKSSRQ